MNVSVMFPGQSGKLMRVQVGASQVEAYAIASMDQVGGQVPRGGYDGFNGPDGEGLTFGEVRDADDALRAALPATRVVRSAADAKLAADDGAVVFALYRHEYSPHACWFRCAFVEGTEKRGRVVRRTETFAQ